MEPGLKEPIEVAGVTVAPEVAGDELLFVLPRGAASVELVSSVGVPAETSAQPGVVGCGRRTPPYGY